MWYMLSRYAKSMADDSLFSFLAIGAVAYLAYEWFQGSLGSSVLGSGSGSSLTGNTPVTSTGPGQFSASPSTTVPSLSPTNSSSNSWRVGSTNPGGFSVSTAGSYFGTGLPQSQTQSQPASSYSYVSPFPVDTGQYKPDRSQDDVIVAAQLAASNALSAQINAQRAAAAAAPQNIWKYCGPGCYTIYDPTGSTVVGQVGAPGGSAGGYLSQAAAAWG